MGKYQSTKLFDNYSVAIRQWKAQHSHCQLLHGYALKFKVWFESVEPLEENQLDEMNWIQDYGGFKSVPVGNGLKDWMDYMWDHTLLIEKDDPYLDLFESMNPTVCHLRVMDKIGAESAAKLVYDKFNDTLSKQGGGRVKVTKVECWEADKNSSIYQEDPKPMTKEDPKYSEFINFKNQMFKNKEYDFVLFFNSRNIRRKQIPDTLLAYKLFIDSLPEEKAKKCALLMHTQKLDENGTDLRAISKTLAPNCKILFSEHKLNADDLNAMYNVADVVVKIFTGQTLYIRVRFRATFDDKFLKIILLGRVT